MSKKKKEENPNLDNEEQRKKTPSSHHDQVHVVLVLVRAVQRHHVRAPSQMVHYLHLAPHVLDVLGRRQLALGDRLAGQLAARRALLGEARRAELALAEDAAEDVERGDVLGGFSQDAGLGLAGLGGLEFFLGRERREEVEKEEVDEFFFLLLSSAALHPHMPLFHRPQPLQHREK